jgi:sigma-E factor negative regulatory protein RseC
MIEEQAQVVEIKGDKLLLQTQVQSTCGACSVSKGCGTSVLAKVVGRKFTQFQVENNVNAKIGDTVIVGITEGLLVKGSLMIYTVPLLAMIIFAVLADYIFVEALSGRDAWIAVSAIAGLIAGALLSKWYFSRHASGGLYSPVVLRKIIGHGKLHV